MTMPGPWLRMVLLLVLLLAGHVAAQNGRFPAFDPERIFVFGDADLDDRLSLDEYRELLRSSPRMKSAVATIEPLFRRFDIDHDGFLSLSEYSRSFPPGSSRGRCEVGRFQHERVAYQPSGGGSGSRGDDHARRRKVLRGEDPAGARVAMWKMPREHRRETAGRTSRRHPARASASEASRAQPLCPASPRRVC